MNIPLVWRTMLLASMKSFQHGAYLAKEKQELIHSKEGTFVAPL